MHTAFIHMCLCFMDGCQILDALLSSMQQKVSSLRGLQTQWSVL